MDGCRLSLVELTFTRRSLVQAMAPPSSAAPPLPPPPKDTCTLSPPLHRHSLFFSLSPFLSYPDQNLPIDKQCTASLVVQWERISLAVKATKDLSPWPRKISHASRQLSLFTTITEPVLQSPETATTEPTCHSY